MDIKAPSENTTGEVISSQGVERPVFEGVMVTFDLSLQRIVFLVTLVMGYKASQKAVLTRDGAYIHLVPD